MNLIDFVLRAKLNDNEFRAAIEVNQLIKYHRSLVTAKTVHMLISYTLYFFSRNKNEKKIWLDSCLTRG